MNSDNELNVSLRALSNTLPYSQARRLSQKIVSHLDGNPKSPGVSLQLAVAGQTTTTPLIPLLRAYLLTFGINAEVFEAPFSTLFQELLDQHSALTSFAPRLIVLLPHESCLEVDTAEQALELWQPVWEAANKIHAQVIQGNYVLPECDAFGHLAQGAAISRRYLLLHANQLLAQSLPSHVHYFDNEMLSAKVGKQVYCAASWWYSASLCPSPAALPTLAHSLASLTSAIWGKSKKVAVLDLDNTLWGGVVGECGPEHIEIGNTGLGRAFADFQRYLLALQQRGILLVVISKNDLDMAISPFRERPEMVLKEEHILVFSASWDDKPGRLAAIANQLRLGLDSFVFIDDQMAERELMRQLLPEVAVLELPDDPSLYANTLAASGYFETACVTSEDLERNKLYRAEHQRQQLQNQCNDLTTYLHSLEMVLSVGLDGQYTRVAQLLAKTNQFNLTGRRFSEAELSQNYLVLYARLTDKFGDQGIISALVLHRDGASLTIVNWVMSCRVLKRSVEQSIFAALTNYARDQQITAIHGQRLATKRNGQTSELLPSLGFSPDGVFAVDADNLPQPPAWIRLEGI